MFFVGGFTPRCNSSVTDAGQVIAAEIERRGPIPFRRFMEIALYHPEFGYYRKALDPFGRSGDFYTAEQLQPVFGRLVRKYIDALLGGESNMRTVVELGAGRADMAEAFSGLNYVPVDVGYGEMPDEIEGVVFANEFFDALPVDVVTWRGERPLLQLVTIRDGRFHWTDGEQVSAHILGDPFDAQDGDYIELCPDAGSWIVKIAAALLRGYLLIIDYGYTQREWPRYRRGTLMSYRRHVASEDVLRDPGDRDITSHVRFTYLEQCAHASGFSTVRFENLSSMLLTAGEHDSLESAITAANERDAERNRLQLKTLLFGMGETFRVLLLRKTNEAK